MRKALFLLVLFGIVYLQNYKTIQPEILVALPSPTLSPVLGLVVNEKNLLQIEFKDKKYRYFRQEINDSTKVMVGINNGLDKPARKIFRENQCQVLTSGTFYDQNFLPMGLVKNQKEILSDLKQNQLFNGVLVLGNLPRIIDLEGQIEASESAMQAGPVLWQNGQPIELKLNQDQTARRLVAVINNQNQMEMVMVLGGDSLFSGSTLSDLPAILAAIYGENQIRSALNLDGGSASALITSDFQLAELKGIGSYVCFKK